MFGFTLLFVNKQAAHRGSSAWVILEKKFEDKISSWQKLFGDMELDNDSPREQHEWLLQEREDWGAWSCLDPAKFQVLHVFAPQLGMHRGHWPTGQVKPVSHKGEFTLWFLRHCHGIVYYQVVMHIVAWGCMVLYHYQYLIVSEKLQTLSPIRRHWTLLHGFMWYWMVWIVLHCMALCAIEWYSICYCMVLYAIAWHKLCELHWSCRSDLEQVLWHWPMAMIRKRFYRSNFISHIRRENNIQNNQLNSDSVVLYVRSHFLRFWACLPIYIIYSYDNFCQ